MKNYELKKKKLYLFIHFLGIRLRSIFVTHFISVGV